MYIRPTTLNVLIARARCNSHTAKLVGFQRNIFIFFSSPRVRFSPVRYFLVDVTTTRPRARF